MAEAMPMSSVTDFFASKAFSNYRASNESRQKLALATLGRFDNIAKGMGALGKAIIAVLRRR